MHIGGLVVRNALRSPLRTGMTVLTVALMLAAFVFPRTLVDAQEDFARNAPHDRVIVLPKQGWVGALPARYSEEIRATEGIKHAVGVRWAGFQLPGKDDVFFASNAVEAVPFIAMHHEIVAPAAEKQAFLADERSALVSRDLARKHGWKLGDRLIFKSGAFAGEWAVTVACVYDAMGAEWAKRSLWVHYAFFNRSLPAEEKDKLMFVSAQVDDPNRGGQIARSIDAAYDSAPVRTLSMEDKVLAAAQIGRIGAILRALDLVSYLILFIVLAILFNTLTLSVRERTREFGVLRAIGFGPRHICALVLGEAALLGLAGGAVGLGLSFALLEGLIGPYLEENLQFAPLEVPWRVTLTASLASVALAMLSAGLPAARLARLEVREALGRVA